MNKNNKMTIKITKGDNLIYDKDVFQLKRIAPTAWGENV